MRQKSIADEWTVVAERGAVIADIADFFQLEGNQPYLHLWVTAERLIYGSGVEDNYVRSLTLPVGI